MTEPRRTPPPKPFACAACGALNSPGFDRCIRCGVDLTGPADTARAAAAPRSPQQGPSPQGATHHYWATTTIVWTTLVIFAGQVLASFSRGAGFPVLSGGHPVDLLRFGMMPIDVTAVRDEPFRLVSCVFVHFGGLHFAMNMMGLINFGRVAEPAVGSARFALAYVLSGVAGSVATIAHSGITRPGGTTAGASGAIFGIMGLLLGWLIRQKNPAWKDFAIQAVFFSVLLGFGVNAANTGVMINNSAHIGGLVCGVALGLLFGGRRPPGAAPAREAAVNVGSAICLLVCLASLIMAQLSPKWRRLSESLRSHVEPRPEPPALMHREARSNAVTKTRHRDV